MARVFISYKRVDKAKVFKLKDTIEAAIGEECWIDIDGIESDAMFKSVIIKAINESEIFLFMYSKAHSTIVDFEHDWTVRELTFAELKKKRIVFINIDGSTLSDLFLFDYANKQQVDATSPQALDRLCTDLQKWLGKLEADTLSPSEMVKLGEDYYYGENEKQKDYQEAVEMYEFYRQAAEQGYAVERFSIEHSYENGEGISKDSSEALKWYHEAAEYGLIEAQFYLGICFEKGYRVAQNKFEALKWYRKAAEQGDKLAQYYLAYCYEDGQGIAKNFINAYKWYRKSAEQGLAIAQQHLGYCYYYGQGVDENKSEAAKWFLKAAEQGESDAQCYLGACYEQGQGVSKNLDEAVKWYRKAAEQGNAEAKKRLKANGILL